MPQTDCPDWLRSAIFYQIYPQSYFDTNRDGIGDLPGIIAKLDYIQSLGVTALWLNPCFVSPFQDAGYDVADYCQIAPRYGTNDDMRQLCAEAHKRGMRICLDLVAGHTSIQHPWFKAACQPEKNEYSDCFIWTGNGWDFGANSGQQFIKGFADRDGCYAINFFYSQPALNYGFQNPDPKFSWQQPVSAPGPQRTRAELKKSMQFWLDMGVDGFRVDMASSLIKNDPEKVGTIALWNEFRAWLEKDYPEAVLIAEWGEPQEAIRAGYHADFMIHFNAPGYPQLFFFEDIFSHETLPAPFFQKEGQGSVIPFLTEYMKQRALTKGKGYISLPTANHDFQRPCWNRDREDLEVIFAFLMSWPGLPVLYYGDEIGMRYIPDMTSKEGGYGRTGTRTPMQWSAEKNAGFSEGAPESLYLPVDPDPQRPNVEAQDKNPDSMLNFTRALLKLRQSSPALGNDGELGLVYAEDKKYPFVYTRYAENGERFLVVVNPAARTEKVSLPLHLCSFASAEAAMARGVAVGVADGKIEINAGACSFGIFRLR